MPCIDNSRDQLRDFGCKPGAIFCIWMHHSYFSILIYLLDAHLRCRCLVDARCSGIVRHSFFLRLISSSTFQNNILQLVHAYGDETRSWISTARADWQRLGRDHCYITLARWRGDNSIYYSLVWTILHIYNAEVLTYLVSVATLWILNAEVMYAVWPVVEILKRKIRRCIHRVITQCNCENKDGYVPYQFYVNRR